MKNYRSIKEIVEDLRDEPFEVSEFELRIHPQHGIPYIKQITQEDSVICLKLPEVAPTQPVTRNPQPVTILPESDFFDDLIGTSSGQQLTLF